MSRKKHQQNLPHYGVKNKMIRKDHRVKDADGNEKSFPSVGMAKRFMRTGK
jgi:hypothetical protein